jgi:hypothetical protein
MTSLVLFFAKLGATVYNASTILLSASRTSSMSWKSVDHFHSSEGSFFFNTGYDWFSRTFGPLFGHIEGAAKVLAGLEHHHPVSQTAQVVAMIAVATQHPNHIQMETRSCAV